MHNGSVADFDVIKRKLQNDLPDIPFDTVKGNTGTSRLFRCFRNELTIATRFGMGIRGLPIEGTLLVFSLTRRLNVVFVQLPNPTAKSFTPEVLRKAMESTIAQLNEYRKQFKVTEVLPLRAIPDRC